MAQVADGKVEGEGHQARASSCSEGGKERPCPESDWTTGAKGHWHTTPACAGSPIILEIPEKKCSCLGLFTGIIFCSSEAGHGVGVGSEGGGMLYFIWFPIMTTDRNQKMVSSGCYTNEQKMVPVYEPLCYLFNTAGWDPLAQKPSGLNSILCVQLFHKRAQTSVY